MNADQALYEFQMKLKEAEETLRNAIKIAADEFGSNRDMDDVMDALDDVIREDIMNMREIVEDVRQDIASYYFEQGGITAISW